MSFTQPISDLANKLFELWAPESHHTAIHEIKDDKTRLQLLELSDSWGIDPSYEFLSWRMRTQFSLPQTWKEVGLFVGLAIAIQASYWVFNPGNDIEPDEFPAECINPVKRQDMIILAETQRINSVFFNTHTQHHQIANNNNNYSLQDPTQIDLMNDGVVVVDDDDDDMS
jgi:hypothetical protein